MSLRASPTMPYPYPKHNPSPFTNGQPMSNLDSSQRAFVEAPNNHIRLLAPAGCGKTLCLLNRCLHLKSLSPTQKTRFLIVTFTVAARHELQTRLLNDADLVDLHESTEITTLNSWGWRRVQSIATNAKTISSNYDLNTTVENQLQPIWQHYPNIIEAMKGRLRFTPRRLLKAMDTLKSLGFIHTVHTDYESFSHHIDQLLSHNLGWQLLEQIDGLTRAGVLPETSSGATLLSSPSGRRTLYESFFTFWIEACRFLGDSAQFTLDDQKYFAYLDESSKLAAGTLLSGAASYDHVLVDEFQDINPLDLNLIAAIVERNRAKLTIVGDDDQAIYEWRGATPEYIVNPERFLDIPIDTFTLKVNYRSPRNIVDHSQRLIKHNERRVDKEISAHTNEDASIEVQEVHGVTDAIQFVENLVDDIAATENGLPRVAIIGRKRSQIIPFQVSFASKNLPFCAAEDLQVFLSDAFQKILDVIGIKGRIGRRQRQSEIIKDVIRLCDLVRRYPVSKSDKRFLRSHLQNMNVRTMSDAIEEVGEYRGPLKGKNKDGKVSKEMADAARDFADAVSVTAALLALDRSFEGLQIDFDKAEEDVFYTDPPFGQLAEFARRYGDDYDQFLDDIERAQDQLVHLPSYDDGISDPYLASIWKRPLHLMTAPRAKGKEFDVVILLGANEGIWPHKNSKTAQQKEADRRVFYVAFTRAKRKVVILVNVGSEGNVAPPSRFVGELGLPI